ncbi:MAG: acetoacetate metabolism regulatory protein AtoC [bacterium]|nr:MAG: acetoacetate metabolism regulatory protein AtoC [bacterium]
MTAGERILVVDDDESMRSALAETLTRCGHLVDTADVDCINKMEAKDYRLVIADVKTPGTNGLEILEQIKNSYPKTGVILITAYGTVDTAVESMKKGADDYLLKPFSGDALESAVKSVLDGGGTGQTHASAVAVKNSAASSKNGSTPEREFLTCNKTMKEILQMAERTASSTASVLISGESGTGKELVARYIHRKSKRSSGRFVAVNCAALPENLLESEFFGYEKGAFTGAISRKTGKFELADHGTILLDEITEMNVGLQAKLLRVLQEKEIDRVGGTSPVPLDVRIIATTNKHIDEAIAQGRFREDLYFRLNVIPITIPPLRERMEDLPLLVEHFIKKFSLRCGAGVKGIAKEAMEILGKCRFKGNVRELENIIERAVLFCRSDTILPQDLFPVPPQESGNITAGEFKLTGTVEEMERKLIMGTLERVGDNRTRAAGELGISIRTLRNKLKAYKNSGGNE